MKVSIDKWKLSQSGEGRLGLLVTIGSKYLPLSPSIDTAIVGQCACCEAAKKNANLSSLDLPTPDWEGTAVAIRRHFPAGFDYCSGVWLRVQSSSAGEDEEEYRAYLTNVLDTLLKDTNLKAFLKYKPFLLVAMPSQASYDGVQCFSFNSNAAELELEPVEYVPGPVSNHLVQNTVMVRLSASLPLYLTTDEKAEGTISSLIKRIQSPSSFFYVPSHHLLFNDTTPEDKLLPAPSKDDSHSRSSSSKTMINSATANYRKQLGFNCNATSVSAPLLVSILESASPMDKDKDESSLPYAPTLTVSEPLTGPCVRISLSVDVLGFLRPSLPLFEVATVLKEAIAAQLSYAAEAITWKDDMVNGVKIFATPLHTQACPVTILMPDKYLKLEEKNDPEDGKTDQPTYTTAICRGPQQDRLQSQHHLRQLLSFRSSIDEEYFQVLSNVLQGQQLKNPHLAVKHSPVAGGRLALVQGDYLYYHYMQDGFNDNVWGCAYRSLQTLASWFLLQMYTSKAPPTHQQIQQALVDVGDKEASLVGSKEWIGSFEVSACLNHLLGVQCKIHHCSSGSEMAGVGSMLLSHFQTYGTPIMIGGGVLAHTILGVDYSDSTGEIQFLILDPHYTGKDDLKTITDKGWCGWKPVSFWDKTAHYNLCMPLTENIFQECV